MGKGLHHNARHQRFEDHASTPQDEASSFFFDLKLMLPPGMTAHDVEQARQTIERRLHRTLRKKDRLVWTAEGFFISIGTEHPARAAAAAERIHRDLCEVLAGKAAQPALCESKPHNRVCGEHASPHAQPRALQP